MLRSFAHIQGKRHLYQESPLSALRRPEELVTYCFGTTSGLPEGTIMFCGTVPANGGIQAARRFEMVLIDPILKRTIKHSYDVFPLPIVT